jgi:hypothetical protein
MGVVYDTEGFKSDTSSNGTARRDTTCLKRPCPN